jgi:hypothetical protein
VATTELLQVIYLLLCLVLVAPAAYAAIRHWRNRR